MGKDKESINMVVQEVVLGHAESPVEEEQELVLHAHARSHTQ